MVLNKSPGSFKILFLFTSRDNNQGLQGLSMGFETSAVRVKIFNTKSKLLINLVKTVFMLLASVWKTQPKKKRLSCQGGIVLCHILLQCVTNLLEKNSRGLWYDDTPLETSSKRASVVTEPETCPLGRRERLMRPHNLPGTRTNTTTTVPKDFWKVQTNSKSVLETWVSVAVIFQSSPDTSPFTKEKETNSHLAESFPCSHADCVQSVNSTFARLTPTLGCRGLFLIWESQECYIKIKPV